MKLETKKILLAILVISLVLVSGLSAMTVNASAQGAFTPSKEMKIITQEGNNVTFPLGSVGISLPNAINPMYTETQKPSGYIQVLDYSPDVLPSTFILYANFDGGLKPYTYQWYLNGNPIAGATGPHLVYTATSAGVYTFEVKVTDQAFNVGTATKHFIVYGPLQVTALATNGTAVVSSIPTSEVTQTPQLISKVNSEVVFQITISGGYPYYNYYTHRHYYRLYYRLGDVNDGWYFYPMNVYVNETTGVATAVIPYSYSEVGIYTPQFYVRDASGAVTDYMNFVIGVVTGPLQTSMGISPVTPSYGTQNGLPIYLVGETIYFYGTIQGGVPPYSYVWNYGDGQAYTGATYSNYVHVNHVYNHQGLYRVWFNVTDCMGNEVDQSIQFWVMYRAPVNANLGINDTSMNATQAANATFVNTITVTAGANVVDYTLNITWEFGKAPYVINVTLYNQSTGNSYWVLIPYNDPWSDLPYYINQTGLHALGMPYINHTGLYRITFTVTDSEGYSVTSQPVYINVVAPQFSAEINAVSTDLCYNGTNTNTTIIVIAHNILWNDTTHEATVNVTVYDADTGNVVYTFEGNVTGSTQYFDDIWSFQQFFNTTGTYHFYAVVKELSPVNEAYTTTYLTINVYTSHGLVVSSFGASPQGLQGTAPYTVTFYINLTGGNGTLKGIFLSNHPNPEYEYTWTTVASGGPPCNPWYNITFTYTYANVNVYNTQFTFYSNNSAYTGPVYVNFTVTVYPPPPMHASFNVDRTVVYLEPGPNMSLAENYTYYNYTSVTISVSGGTVPYFVYFYIQGKIINNDTLIDMTPGVSYNVGITYYYTEIQILIPNPMTIHFNLYFNHNSTINMAGLKWAWVDISSAGSTCDYTAGTTINVVDVPVGDITSEYGANAPTDIVAYGKVYDGARPYKAVWMTIDGQTFTGEVTSGYNFGGVVTGSLMVDTPGTYKITLYVRDANGYVFEWTENVVINPVNFNYPVVIGAHMQVYFDNVLVYSGPAVWNSQGTLNATFLMPNQKYTESRTFSVNVQFSYTLYVPAGYYGNPSGYYYNVYSPYPYNSQPGKLTVVVGGMLTGVDVSSDLATIKTMISGVWQTVNVSADSLKSGQMNIENGILEIKAMGAEIKSTLSAVNATIQGISDNMVVLNTKLGQIKATLDQLNATLISIDNGVMDIKTAVGNLQASVSDLNAKVDSISGDVATIKTDVGTIKASVSDLDAKITKLQGDVATIQTTLGTVNVKLDAINATVVSNAKGISDLKGSVVEIQTTLGTIKGTVTDIKDGVATIQTDLGTVQTDVNNIKTNTANTANSVNTTLYWQIGVLILVIITLALVAYVIVQVNKIAKKSEVKEEKVEEETTEEE